MLIFELYILSITSFKSAGGFVSSIFSFSENLVTSVGFVVTDFFLQKSRSFTCRRKELEKALLAAKLSLDTCLLMASLPVSVDYCRMFPPMASEGQTSFSVGTELHSGFSWQH